MVNLKDYESAHRGRLAFRISLGDEKRDRIYMAKIKPRPSKDGKGPVYLDLAQLLPPVELRDETIYPESGDTVAFDEPPVLIEAFEPVYPEKAKRAGIGGTVKMILIVDNEGNVWDVHAFTTNKGVDSLLINAAVEAAYKNKYKPAMLKGKPVAACAVYKAVFIPDYF